MKYTSLMALMFVATTSAVTLSADPPAKGAKPAELGGAPAKAAAGGADPEDAWLTIPKFTDDTKDKMPWAVDEGGVPVERVGHADWLDKHVEEVRHIKSLVPPYPAKEDRIAVADS